MINKLVIGTAQFGMSYGISNQNGQVNRHEISNILDTARKSGINGLDTARLYGNSEEVIGGYLKKRPGFSWDVTTKLDSSNACVHDQLIDSINRLTVQPTVVMAHSADLFLNNKFQKEISVAIRDGLVSKMGVSLYDKNEIYRVLDSPFKPNVIQLPMNILDTQLYRNGVITKIYSEGIEIHVRSAFLQGLLYLSEVDLETHFSDAIPYIDKLKSISAMAGVTLAELSLLWLIRLEEVNKVIVGLENVGQLKTHMQTLNKEVDNQIFEEALLIHYENDNILNPSLWP